MGQLQLTETTPADYEAYYKIRCSPSDIYCNGYAGPPDKERFKSIYLSRLSSARFSQPEDRNLYLITLNEPVISIGFVQLIHRGDAVEIGYSVSEAFQRQGYATEALRQAVNLAEGYRLPIILQIRDDNVASQKVAIHNGFSPSDRFCEKSYPKAGLIRLRTYFLRSNEKNNNGLRSIEAKENASC